MSTFQPRKWTRCLIVTGCINMAIGIFITTFVPIYLKKAVHDNFAVDGPAAQGINSFIEIPKSQATVYQGYYIFNISNPDDILIGKDPIVTEHGPYTYSMRTWHPQEDFVWRADGTLEYKTHTEFEFIPEMSVGAESDLFTTVNLGYVGALNQMRALPPFVKMINDMIKAHNISLFMQGENQLNVSQIIWGYKNELLELLSETFGGTVNPIVQIQVKNDTLDKVLPAAVKSGGPAGDGYPQTAYGDLKKMTMWNGMKGMTNYWATPYANMINGTNGMSFRPYMNYGDDVEAFVDTFYRSCVLSSCGKSTFKGVKLYCMHLRPDMLQDMYTNPENAAFGMTTTGFIASPTSVGQPIHFSQPRYYKANLSDPLVGRVQYASGLPRTGDTCDTELMIEPFTGQIFEGHKRIQVNTLLEPGVTVPDNTTHSYLPVVWVDQYPVTTDEAVRQVKVMVYLPYYGSLTVGPFLIALGLGMVIVSVLRCSIWKRKDTKDLDENTPLTGYSDGEVNKSAY